MENKTIDQVVEHSVVGYLQRCYDTNISVRFDSYNNSVMFFPKLPALKDPNFLTAANDREIFPLESKVKASFAITNDGVLLRDLTIVEKDPVSDIIYVSGRVKSVVANNIEKKYQYKFVTDDGAILTIHDSITGILLRDCESYTLGLSIRWDNLVGSNGRFIENKIPTYTTPSGKIINRPYKQGYCYRIRQINTSTGRELFKKTVAYTNNDNSKENSKE